MKDTTLQVRGHHDSLGSRSLDIISTAYRASLVTVLECYSTSDYNEVAYVVVGKEYGQIGMDVAISPEYSFYPGQECCRHVKPLPPTVKRECSFT